MKELSPFELAAIGAAKKGSKQYTEMPTASADFIGSIVQFTGTTTSTYINGYFYKCIESSGTYSWARVDVQPSGGSGSDSVFVATFGTTTAAEVAAALTAGKAVICDYVNNDIHCQMLLETESNSKYTFTEAGVATNNGVTSVYGYGAALNKSTNAWEIISGSGTIPSTAEQLTYNSALAEHTAGSVGAELASHGTSLTQQSSQIEELQNDLTNKTATSMDIGKTPIVKAVSNGKVSEWGFGTGARKVYGFHIDSSESDPSTAVTYLEDAVGMTPAAMNFSTGVFSYGSWANAFFMPRPCMLKYDGTVDYYLDPDDYSKKEDGVTASDVADTTYGGNAMMEWGQNGKRIWYKIVPDADPTSASIYIADNKYDDDYRAWSFYDINNKLIDHFYTPIYNGTLDSDGRLRSISGLTSASYCQSKNASQEITAAELNNAVSTNKMWYTEQWSDIFLVNMLLVLIGKSLNTQAVFGNGRINQTSAITSCLDTGTMNDKGLFYGSNGNNDGVKVFGMENWWGNHWRRFAGMIMVDYVQKYKMTRGTADGSTASDYNITASGYLTGGTAPQSNNYISKHEFNADGMYVNATNGTASTYYSDYFWQNSGTRYACRGGACYFGASCGAFCLSLDHASSFVYWVIGAAPSCKPLS